MKNRLLVLLFVLLLAISMCGCSSSTDISLKEFISNGYVFSGLEYGMSERDFLQKTGLKETDSEEFNYLGAFENAKCRKYRLGNKSLGRQSAEAIAECVNGELSNCVYRISDDNLNLADTFEKIKRELSEMVTVSDTFTTENCISRFGTSYDVMKIVNVGDNISDKVSCSLDGYIKNKEDGKMNTIELAGMKVK